MKANEIKPLPTRADIYAYVTSEEIFLKYLGMNKIPAKTFKSPLRTKDEHPSFSIFWSLERNMYLFKDFSTGESGDAIKFAELVLGIPFKEVLCQLAYDFGLHQFETKRFDAGMKVTRKLVKIKKEAPKSTAAQIQFKERKWNVHDIIYWETFGIDIFLLKQCGVVPISHYFIYKRPSIADRLAYAYIEYKDDKYTVKIYQPQNRHGRKWISNNNTSVWELWRQLPDKGDICIIASSRKDAMVIKSLFPSSKVTSVSLQNEGAKPKGSVIAELKSRFRRVYSLYDNDEAGEESSKMLEEKYGVCALSLMHMNTAGKDVAEIRALKGRKVIRNLIIEQIKSRPKAECKIEKPF